MLIFKPAVSGVCTIEGEPKDLEAFVRNFQTYLWPEWESHPDGEVTRERFEKCRKDLQKGRAYVSTQGKECRSAFLRAMEDILREPRKQTLEMGNRTKCEQI